MTEPPEGGCFRCIISLIFTSGFAALFLWLSLKTSNPICSIEQFYLFALNKTTNHTIFYDLKLKNKNNDKGIYYNTLNLTFYYKSNGSTYPIGYSNHSGFYQGHKKSTHRYGNVNVTAAAAGVPWEKVAVSENGSVVVRVELVTIVRFKILFWKKKGHHLMLGGDLVVDDQGSLVKKKKNKGIKLCNSSVGKVKECFTMVISFVSVVIFCYF